MSDIVIFDTSVLVDEVRTGRHRTRIESVDGLVRTSSVVLAELWRGVIGRDAGQYSGRPGLRGAQAPQPALRRSNCPDGALPRGSPDHFKPSGLHADRAISKIQVRGVVTTA